MRTVQRLMVSLAGVGGLLLLGACPGPSGDASKAITSDNLSREIQVLASDSFGGRGPSSPGEDKTINYIKTQFQSLGLAPGNGADFFQTVPLVKITPDTMAVLTVAGRGKNVRLRFGDQFVAWSPRVQAHTEVTQSDVVFVGYGVVAPEYNWNDYAGLDVKGKTVLILVNDPGWSGTDSTLFRGKTMTYYGRWTYKFEEAARQGAAAAIIIHETAPAAYGWNVVRSSNGAGKFWLQTDDNNMSRCAFEGWMTVDAARLVFRAADQDYDLLKRQADTRGFKPLPLRLRASMSMDGAFTRSTSHNVIGLFKGTDRADQYVIYTAHWDHLGTNPGVAGPDKIYNGARDNASGTAGLIELARAFTKMGPQHRSVLFIAVTAEEQGLLGSDYYATHPVYPLKQTVADINMDALNVWGRTKDITVVGLGNSELDDYITQAAKDQGRTVRPDPEPEKGLYYRSDHFSFAKQGLPALDPDGGVDNIEHGEAWQREQMDKYTSQDYHQPSDQWDPTWNLSGMVEDLQLLLSVGQRLASESTFPNWRVGNEFRAARDKMMGNPPAAVPAAAAPAAPAKNAPAAPAPTKTKGKASKKR
ncbi:MAG TPA: M28 family metallopeptidase [Gemmatimonadales bacterium]